MYHVTFYGSTLPTRKTCIEHIGFSISEKGRRVDTRKLTNIHEWPRPTTSNAAMLMAPIDFLRSHDVKNKGKPFKWTSVHDMHFNFLKKILSSDIVLSHPDLNHPFCIATDSSDYATGCCLYQEYRSTTTEGTTKTVIKYIGFFSRKLSDSESRYSATMRELLGVIYAFIVRRQVIR